MPEVRQRFSEELRALEDEVQQTATQARLLLEQALRALVGGDLATCDQVVSGDDEVDALYLDVEQRILHLFALQTPVATDLRLLTALLHINLHLERVGDQAVNIAKIVRMAEGLPQIPAVVQDLEEMGKISLRMIGAAMDALARRDVDLARKLPELDDPIDQLNREMLPKVLEVSDNKLMLEWGIRMYVVSRQIERIGDNAVDIGGAGGIPRHRPVPGVHRCLTSGNRTPRALGALRGRRAEPDNKPPAQGSGPIAGTARRQLSGLSVREALMLNPSSTVGGHMRLDRLGFALVDCLPGLGRRGIS